MLRTGSQAQMGGDTDNTQAARTDKLDVHRGVSKQNSNHTLQKVRERNKELKFWLPLGQTNTR